MLSLLALWCAVVVGTADNFLRPMLVGKDTQMPGLLVMLSTFGGLTPRKKYGSGKKTDCSCRRET